MRGHVCSGQPEFRKECGASCDSCRFLIGERRSRATNRVQWSEGERRTFSGSFSFPAVAYAGAPAATFGRERKAAASFYLLSWLVAFNLLDCLFTVRALTMGYLEGNPVMAALIEFNLPLALLSKTLVVGLGAVFLWHYRHLAIALQGLKLLTAAYGLLVIYHIFFQLAA